MDVWSWDDALLYKFYMWRCDVLNVHGIKYRVLRNHFASAIYIYKSETG
jgi:hypothetical protein